MYTPNYPETVAEVLKDDIKFKAGVVEAVQKFKDSNPKKGTVNERADKIFTLYKDLAAIYGAKCPTLYISPIPEDPNCHYSPAKHYILLNDKMSIVTALHEFGHALGKDEKQTCTWSINLYRKVFPDEYAKLVPFKHLLWKPKSLEGIAKKNGWKPELNVEPVAFLTELEAKLKVEAQKAHRMNTLNGFFNIMKEMILK